MLRLRRPSGLCSRTLSDPANRLLKRTDSEGSSSAAEKKSSAVPLFAAVTYRQSAPDYPRERGDPQEGGNRRCLPSCAPARRQRRLSTLLCARAASAQMSTLLCARAASAQFRSLLKRHSAVLHQNAKEEHCCLAVSLFAHITGFCFPDFSAVQHWPHGGALLRSPEALSPALQRTRVSPGRCAYARDSRSYPRTDRAFSADD